MNSAVARVRASIADGLRPDPELTISEWADRYRVLSSKESPEPGPWRTDRAPYLREIMDCLSPTSPVRRVVVMKASQVGLSEVAINLAGFAIHHAPAPILVVQPTDRMAERFSRQRIASMIENTPPVRARVTPTRSRDGGNTLHEKEFPGGILIIATASSAAELASTPVRFLILDEIERYPLDVGGEGGSDAIAEQRTSNFRRAKILKISSPKFTDGPIHLEYEASDQRRLWVPCVRCGAFQRLEWERVEYPKGEPDKAVYVCEHCARAWNDAQRYAAVREGDWRAAAPFRGTAGFQLSALYSPWARLGELADEYEKKRPFPEKHKTFVNTKLGLPYSDSWEAMDDTGFLARREPYPANPLPRGVVLLTAGVDTQDDRIELEILGWGRDEENWSIDYKVLWGDPSGPGVWAQLDQVLHQVYRHPTGAELPILASCIDTQGHHTQQVYKFCAPRWAERVWAIRGQGGDWRPIVGRPSRNNAQKVPVFPVGVDTVKAYIYNRLKIERAPDRGPTPGYCHFPMRYEHEHFRQLTAEVAERKYVNGRARVVWKLLPGRRNERLDCRAYAVAALYNLRVDLNQIAADMEGGAEDADAEPAERPPAPPDRPRSNAWVNSWRQP